MWKENRNVYLENPESEPQAGGTHVDIGSKSAAIDPSKVADAAARKPELAAVERLRALDIALDAQPSTIESLETKINRLTNKAERIAAIKEAHDATGTAIKDLAQKMSEAENKFKGLRNSSAGAKDLKLRVIENNFPVLYGNLQALEANYASETGAVIAVGHPRNPESSFDGNVRMFLEYHNAIAPALEKANADLKQVVAMNNEAAEKLQAQAKVSAVVAGT